ncbi:hypothetical protein bcere0020_55600 [Bacillus cereus Rock3-29]|nr:hypothetical protein bcere0020_55600 [Bacillus cereus Rock3-29]
MQNVLFEKECIVKKGIRQGFLFCFFKMQQRSNCLFLFYE